MMIKLTTIMVAMLLSIGAWAQSEGKATLKGDINNDGLVNYADVRALIDYIMKGEHQEDTNQTEPTAARIVVMTDTHVMAPELLVNDGTAWQSFLTNDHKMVDYSVKLFDKMVSDLQTTIRPDLVIITGDLTKDGELVSHQYVASKLAELKAAGIPTLVIPGNHDLGTANAMYYDGDTSQPAETASMEQFATIYADYGYTGSDRESTTLTYACEPISGVVMIGIDTGQEGTLSETTLNWVCDKANEAFCSGKQVITFMHHPLVPHFHGAETFVSYAVLNNYETVRNRLADAHVRLVLTGHFHTSDIARDWNAGLTSEIYDVGTGSLISYPCHYRELTIAADRQQVDVSTRSISELEPGDNFANDSRIRLKNSTAKVAQNRLATYSSMVSLVTPSIGEAFTYHAAGDEHRSTDAQKLMDSLLGSISLAKMLKIINEEKALDYEQMLKSMLKDLSAFGDLQREDQTDDLQLTITLPTHPKIDIEQSLK